MFADNGGVKTKQIRSQVPAFPCVHGDLQRSQLQLLRKRPHEEWVRSRFWNDQEGDGQGDNVHTLKQLHGYVSEASRSSECILLEDEPASFNNYKDILDELYRNSKGMQRYQLFQMKHDMPGSIICRLKPNDFEPAVFDVRYKYDGILVTSERALSLFDDLPSLPEIPMNLEEVSEIYKKVLKYVSAEYHDDPLYQSPTPEQPTQNKAKSKARTTTHQTLPKRNSDPK